MATKEQLRSSKAVGRAHTRARQAHAETQRRGKALASKRSGLRRFTRTVRGAPGMTRWFAEDTCPSRPGLYQVLIERAAGDMVEWCWWNGTRWGWSYADPKDALSRTWREAEGATQAKRWRGLLASEYFAA